MDTSDRLEKVVKTALKGQQKLSRCIGKLFPVTNKNVQVLSGKVKRPKPYRSLTIEYGYASKHFINCPEVSTVELKHPSVLVVNSHISEEQVPILYEYLANCRDSSRHTLLCATGFSEQAMATLIVNKLRGSVSVCAI